ncbi:hypothetical protein [Romboutsia sp. 1001713B170131_170501_G6]|uniref:hypothetical protein n=1 Tax=Romboutsia sp. 1001713B170131_170501_G6 TaxID=2787108 RepID=UPI0018AABBB8|nr:hypothetical protein [Romboutsia sp. 1001713B170131_170501_G6]
MDILITQEAKKQFDKILENSEHKYIRIYKNRPSIYEDAKLDFMLDEMKEDDVLHEVDGYKIIINKRLDCQIFFMNISYGGLMSRDKFSIECDIGLLHF